MGNFERVFQKIKKPVENATKAAIISSTLLVSTPEIKAQTETVSHDPKEKTELSIETTKKYDQNELFATDFEDQKWKEYVVQKKLHEASQTIYDIMADRRYFDEKGSRTQTTWPEELSEAYDRAYGILESAPEGWHGLNTAEDCNSCVPYDKVAELNTNPELLKSELGRKIYGTEMKVPVHQEPKKLQLINPEYAPYWKNPTEVHQTHNKRELIGFKKYNPQRARYEVFYFPEYIEKTKFTYSPHSTEEIQDLYLDVDEAEQIQLKQRKSELERLKKQAEKQKQTYFVFLESLSLDIENIANDYTVSDIYDVLNPDKREYLKQNSMTVSIENGREINEYEFLKKDGTMLVLNEANPDQKILIDKIKKGYYVYTKE